MISYGTIAEAEAALGRSLSTAEMIWYKYTATMPDHLVYHHNILFVLVVFTLVPLPIALIQLRFPRAVAPYKIQPKFNLTPLSFFKCYKDGLRLFVLVGGPSQLSSYPTVKLIGIRTGLPLPSPGEMEVQLAVYLLIEDYGNYWVHRLLHKVHHEFAAPIGFAASYAHWAEMLILSIPTFASPAIVPGHMITLWLWISLRLAESIKTHCGFDFPFSPTKFIPFYGGAEYHDYHHYVGGQSQSNFASILTYCDYIYGTEKGYRFHKAYLAKPGPALVAYPYLQVASIALIGVLAATKPTITSSVTKAAIVSFAVMFSVASLWLPQFIYKTFYYHDYNHSTYRSTHVRRILEAFGAFTLSVN